MAIQECGQRCLEGPVNGFWQGLGQLLQRLGMRLQRWEELSRQRQQLMEMDDRLLKDIGLSRADVERIAGGRRFWDDPVQRQDVLDERYRRSDH